MCFCAYLVEFNCYAPLLFAWGDLGRGDYLRCNVGGEVLSEARARGELRTSVTGEGRAKNIRHWRGVS
jgi:hypothetical protein